jgi:DNA polymerase-3 subunit epsilon/exodeoxyribonuclease X
MAKYILFDTETTGTKEEDRIIQLGGMLISSKTNIEVYNDLCSTTVPIKLEAMEMHNITSITIKNKPPCTHTKFYKKLLELNNNSNYLIAHNIKFDLNMLQKEGFENNYTLIDTLRCTKHLYPDLPHYRLQYVRYAFELYKLEDNEAKSLNITIKAHDAIGDVLILKLLLSKLVATCKEFYPDENPMIKLSKLTKTPVIIKTFNFGKYKGEEIAKVAKKDFGYINWLQQNMGDLDEDMRHTLAKFI